MFHCCATQIRRILEKKQELLQQLVSLSEADASIIIEEMTRKRRKFEMSAISFILHQWVERNRQMRLRKPITNETLKETATKMAAILNLPSFRPSYRWLNRFRGKYKYNDEDLSAGQQGVVGELAVEDIIIEFKDSLPSFMQKEISAITSSAKVEETAAATQMATFGDEFQQNESKRAEVPVLLNDNSTDDFEISDEDDDEEEEQQQQVEAMNFDNNNEINAKFKHSADAVNDNQEMQHNEADDNAENDNDDDDVIEIMSKESNNNHNNNNTKTDTFQTQDFPLNAGSAALLHSIFPHLAVIHQFALLNSDVKALEMISQLGVHMQTQANQGAYKQLSLATSNDVPSNNGDMYNADIDDIVLVE